MDSATVVGLIVFLVAQLVAFIGAVFVAYMKTCVAIEGLKAGVESCDQNIQRIHMDNSNTNKKIEGMSRNLAGVEAVHKLCPYLNNNEN